MKGWQRDHPTRDAHDGGVKLEKDMHAIRICIETPPRPAIAMGREVRDKHVHPMTFELFCFFHPGIQVYLAHWKRRMHSGFDGTFARHAVPPLQNHLGHSGDGVHRLFPNRFD
ncbi:Zinc-type alcohol dehydrogenase-like protein [Fusarium oxysporum f. sp. albedinis]|nr:Zinc-type alcohol dehydrogenase-like protein [Fusarium oxysporum f. sp. albedinis]